jgi:hypothetical protein
MGDVATLDAALDRPLCYLEDAPSECDKHNSFVLENHKQSSGTLLDNPFIQLMNCFTSEALPCDNRDTPMVTTHTSPVIPTFP